MTPAVSTQGRGSGLHRPFSVTPRKIEEGVTKEMEIGKIWEAQSIFQTSNKFGEVVKCACI
jgi:hypothetical protein